MRTLKLYEISNDYIRAIESMLHDENKEEGADLLLDQIKDSFENKAVAVAKYIKSLESESSAVKEAANAMAARAKTLAKQAESLTDYLKHNIEKVGLADAIKCNEFVIKLKQNPPSLVVYDPDLIPDMYKVKREVIDIDNKQLKEDIEAGFEVEGAKVERKKRLVIK